MDTMPDSSHTKEDATTCIVPAGDELARNQASLTPADAGLALAEEAYILPTSPGGRKTTKKYELWSFYAYYGGNSGLGPFNYAQSQQQALMYAAGYDPAILPITPGNCSTGACYLKFAGTAKPVTSVILDISGIQFAIQVVIILFLGAWSDYGTWRPFITVVTTVILYGFCFSWLAMTNAAHWMTACGLIIGTLVTYTVSFAFFQASMAGIARDLPELKASEDAVLDGSISPEQHITNDMMIRNKIGDYGFATGAFVPSLICITAIGIIKALDVTASFEKNMFGYGVLMAYTSGWMVLLCTPWFFIEQRRPGQSLPPGAKMWNIGFINWWEAGRKIYRLREVLKYLIALIILGDSMNTSTTIIYTLQYQVASFELATVNYLTILTFFFQGVGCISTYWLQKRMRWSTRTMLIILSTGYSFAVIWGFVGIWTPNFGYKNLWEIWIWNCYYGFVATYYQVSITMISDLVPRPKLFLFYSFFTIFGKASAFVGPFITSAIIDRAGGNTNMAFAFLLPMTVLGIAMLFTIDVRKAAIEGKRFLEEEAKNVYHVDVQKELDERTKH